MDNTTIDNLIILFAYVTVVAGLIGFAAAISEFFLYVQRQREVKRRIRNRFLRIRN